MAGLNNLDGSRSVFVPTEFQADFGPEVGGDAWSADLLVFNNPSPMEKSRLLLWAQDSAKHCSHVDCVIEQFSLRTESKAWRTSPPARPSDGFPLEFDVSVDGLHDPFPQDKSAQALVATHTLPFTVLARTKRAMSCAFTSPLTLCPAKRRFSGSRTVKLTLVLSPWVLLACQRSPGSHEPDPPKSPPE